MSLVENADGGAAVPALIETMNALLKLVEQETVLVQAGRLADAAAIGPEKSDLAGRYLAATLRLKANAKAWFADRPAALAQLQNCHDLFQASLQANLTVLATAHAVAEGLIRGATSELARRNAPQGYGANGNALGPHARTAQPVALSRAF